MNRNLKKLLKILLTFFILIFVFRHFDFKLKTLFSNIVDFRYLYIALLIPFFNLYIAANRWKLFLNMLGIFQSIRSLVKIHSISIFQGLILPSSQGQDLIRIIKIEQLHPDKRGSAGSTIIIERIFGFVILCLLSLIFSFFSAELPNQKQVIIIIASITFFLFTAIAIILNKNLFHHFANKSFSNKYVQKIYSYLEKMHKALVFFPYSKVFISSVLLILLFQFSIIFNVFLIFKAYGFDIPLSQHLTLYPIISIISMVPLTISGLGIREGFFVYFYSFLNVPADTAIGISLINYSILVLLPAFIGAFLYLNDVIFKK